AVEEALKRRQIAGEILPGDTSGTFRVKRAILDEGLVTIVAPLDGEKSAFRIGIESIRANTSYRNYEIVTPCRQHDMDQRLRAELESQCVKLVRCPDSSNSSQLLNAGA